MKRILLFLCAAALFAACGGGTSKINVKTGGKDLSVEVKSSGNDQSVKTFTDINQKVSTATSFTIFLANFEMDAVSQRKPLTAADQTRITMQLIGDEGTDQKSPFKAGTYKADPSGKFNKLDSLRVSSFADGKETNTDFEATFSGSKITGEVKITSVSADSISGEIDVTEGDKSVKGAFTAKITKK